MEFLASKTGISLQQIFTNIYNHVVRSIHGDTGTEANTVQQTRPQRPSRHPLSLLYATYPSITTPPPRELTRQDRQKMVRLRRLPQGIRNPRITAVIRADFCMQKVQKVLPEGRHRL